MEAIHSSVASIGNSEVGFKVLSYGIGNITEADIKTALTNGAIIFGFRVNTESSAQNLAEKEGIKIATYDIIYNLIEDFRKEMGGLLEPETKKELLGKLRVLALFKTDGRYQILGGKITSGLLRRGALINIAKGQDQKKLGKMTQLQQNKEDVQEAREGSEVGMKIELTDTNILASEGDILEIYEEEQVNRTL
jgi:translation initiation factor IF-2